MIVFLITLVNIGRQELFSSSYNQRFLEASDRDVNVKQFGMYHKVFPWTSEFLQDERTEFFLPYIINLYYVCALARGSVVSRRPESYNSEFKPWWLIYGFVSQMSTGQLVELITLVLFYLQFQDSKQKIVIDNDDGIIRNRYDEHCVSFHFHSWESFPVVV